MREIYEIAKSMDGKIKEVPGSGNNPVIVKMFERILGTSMPDSTAWCAVATGCILLDAGYRSTGKATARSYLDYGQKVSLADAKPGDIAVFWRGSPASWQGHVGIFVRKQCGKIYIYSGNDSNEFKLGSRPENQLLGIRRVTSTEKLRSAPVEPPAGDEVDLDIDLSQFPLALWHAKNIFGERQDEALKIISELSSLLPHDIAEYCSTYKNMNLEGRTAFWNYFLSCLAFVESSLNTKTTYKENFRDSRGSFVISRGLFQLSVESVNGYKRFGTPQVNEDDLHDPLINLKCAVVILKRWIQSDGLIAGKNKTDIRGGSRYWSTLRRNTKHDFIISKCEDAWG